MLRKVTLKEIAKEAGVDVSTASRALAGNNGVHTNTRKRVLAVARELKYRPNLIAKGLVTGRSHTIGLLISDIRNPFFAEVARGAEDAAYAESFEVILCNSDLNPAKQLRYIRSLLDKKIEGILINSVSTLSEAEQQELAGCEVPIVLLNRPAAARHPFSTVSADNRQGGFLVATHLIQLGHRVVAHLTGPRNHGNLAERLKGFLEGVETANSKVTPIIMHGEHTHKGGYDMAKKLFAQRRDVTAIFAGNDTTAFGVVQAAVDAGMTIPDDLSIVGFDNVALSALLSPPLTTVHQPKYEMGQAAVEILLKQARSNGTIVPEQRLFGVSLIERKSCRAVRP